MTLTRRPLGRVFLAALLILLVGVVTVDCQPVNGPRNRVERTR